MVKELILLEADVNIKDNDAEHHRCAQHINNGCTPLHHAVINDNFTIVDELIKAGAEVNAKDNYGRTPLYHAVVNGNSMIINELIRLGADVNIKDTQGHTLCCLQ